MHVTILVRIDKVMLWQQTLKSVIQYSKSQLHSRLVLQPSTQQNGSFLLRTLQLNTQAYHIDFTTGILSTISHFVPHKKKKPLKYNLVVCSEWALTAHEEDQK